MKRRFSAQEGTVTKALVAVMRKMNAHNLKVNKNIMEGDVEIVFDRGGKRYKFVCNTYEDQLDNYRAAQLCIDYLYRALESYGVSNEESSLFDTVFDNFFLGFEATPDDDTLKIGGGDCWSTLGVDKNATQEEIKQAYRSLAKIHHPDNGGDVEQFKWLRKAYDEALEAGR